jgi:hypothetical protein
MGNKIDILKFFHGDTFCMDRWNSKEFRCCRLCKTQSKQGKKKHWARGLCRSCYRRLLTSHRVYNDSWLSDHKKAKQRHREKTGRKEYKQVLETEDIIFDDLDIETLLDRYEWKCAYSNTPLQGFDFKRNDAFQLEYIMVDNKPILVPVCRFINCSKKGLTEEQALQSWSANLKINYPFKYISVEEYLKNNTKILS